MKVWLILFVAIGLEVLATSLLKVSDGLSRLWPSLGVLLGYGLSFYLLAHTLKVLPVGVAYAVWSGVGMAVVTLVGWLWFKQKLDWPVLLGMALVVGGVLLISVYAEPGAH